MQSIHLRNEAKTATLAKLVPHLNEYEAFREKTREEKLQLETKVQELQEANLDAHGTIGGKMFCMLA